MTAKPEFMTPTPSALLEAVRTAQEAIEKELTENMKLKFGATLFDFEMFVSGQLPRLKKALALLKPYCVPSQTLENQQNNLPPAAKLTQ